MVFWKRGRLREVVAQGDSTENKMYTFFMPQTQPKTGCGMSFNSLEEISFFLVIISAKIFANQGLWVMQSNSWNLGTRIPGNTLVQLKCVTQFLSWRSGRVLSKEFVMSYAGGYNSCHF